MNKQKLNRQAYSFLLRLVISMDTHKTINKIEIMCNSVCLCVQNSETDEKKQFRIW